MEILLSSTEDTKKLAVELANKLKPNEVVALYGDLGTGKTTFTGFLVEELGIKARVQSPTFVIARKYSGGEGAVKTLHHIDLYRITDKQSIKDLDLDELFTEEHSATVVEWPELIEELLPKNAIKIKFEYIGETQRKAYVQNLY